jgi:protein RecA
MRHYQPVSTSSLSVDYALCGGFLPGSIIEIFGEEDVGKTSLALGAMSTLPHYADSTLYIDLEKTLFSQHAIHFGLDPKAVNVARPDTLEQTLSLLKAAIESNAFRLIVLDSIPALISSAELGASLTLERTKYQGNLLLQALRGLVLPLLRNNCTLILINQMRSYPSLADPSVYFETSPGGLALKALCSTRLKLERLSQFVDPFTLLATVDVQVDIIKHLPAAPKLDKAQFRIVYSKGFDNKLSLAELSQTVPLTGTTKADWFNRLNLYTEAALDYNNYNL